MKRLVATAFTLLLVYCSFGQHRPTEVVVIGSIHQPVSNFNADILSNIFEQVKPDVILQEMDSSFFTDDFKFKNPSEENEQNATEKYVERHPKTLIRPYEFEGRNEYRRERGMVPTDNLTTKLLKSLYTSNALTPQQHNILKTYYELTNELQLMASKSPESFNNAVADSIAARRQFFQHKKLTEITNERAEFADAYYTMPNGEKISYRDGYQLWASFWDLRNKTMAQNIMRIAEQNQGKRIVVTTGLLHRYYLLSELRELKQGKNILIKEFYEY